jgi:ParB/RepB/Spo0J family partition protein
MMSSSTSTVPTEAAPPLAPLHATASPLDSNSASQNIPLSKIVPSQTNPGRTFDPERDTDIMESIRVHGVLQPILVRVSGAKGCSFKQPGKLEIVAGERRYHCAVKAGRASIPAVIRELSDVQALELQYIENDQREDLDPMAKAAALKRVWDAYKSEGMDARACMSRMIQRTNRKPRTVWNLLSLGNFIERGQQLLRDEKLSLSHAYEIARRARPEQNKILNWYEEQSEYDPISVRDLKDYIREECDHFIDAAPFDKADAQLVPAAGACTACEKNTAVNPNLVDPEEGKKKVKAVCTDGECWTGKVKANLVQIEKAAEKEHGRDQVLRVSTQFATPKGAVAQGQWKEVKGGTCKNTFAAVIVDGDETGKKIFACASPNLCKTHWGSAGSSHYSGASNQRSVSRPRSDSEKKAMLQKQRNKKADQAYRAAATAAIRAQVKELKILDLREVAIVLFDRLDRRLQGPVCVAMGWKGDKKTEQGYAMSYYGVKTPADKIAALSPADLSAFIALLSIADQVLPVGDYFGHRSPIKPDGFALRHKIDLVKIEAEATKDLRARWKEIDARKKTKGGAAQTSAAKADGKKAKGKAAAA